MTTSVLRESSAEAIPRPQLHLAGWIATAGLVLLGIGALAGGIALATAPDGRNMGFSTDLLAGSPFRDFLVPGLILAGLFGVGSLVVAAAGLRHARIAPFLAFAIGVAQMIWIVVELAVIHELSFLHPAMFVLGLVIAIAAVPWGWPTFRAWRADRRRAGATTT